PFIGEIHQLQVRHDNKGLFGSAWFLESINVYDSLPEAEYSFICNGWLDKKHGLKKLLSAQIPTEGAVAISELPMAADVPLEVHSLQRIDDDLLDYEAGYYESQVKGKLGPGYDSAVYYSYTESDQLPEMGPTTTYIVTTKTTKVSNAGTDAKVSIVLNGDLGQTDKINLDKKCKKTKGDPFESGHVDSFVVTNIPSAGTLTTATISHDDSGLASAWHLDSITVYDQLSGQKYFFPYKEWIDKEHGLSQDLVAQDEPVMTNYTITVKTGKKSGSGTDANVYVKLIGDYDESPELHLHTSVKGGNKFETGAENVFKFDNQPFIGEIHQLQVRHDNKGLFGSAWFLESINVYDSLPEAEYSFICNGW
ncbi:MAG: hypothetical protein GY820_40025, partial [Gammaproteobacteria bacterium]|nr:hypothetical protein [Gammaproteobacteria bacterium]